MTERADAVGKRAQVLVLAPGRDRRQAEAAWIDLHERRRAVSECLVGQPDVEGSAESGVVQHEVGLTADGGGELADGLIGRDLVGLGDAQVVLWCIDEAGGSALTGRRRSGSAGRT